VVLGYPARTKTDHRLTVGAGPGDRVDEPVAVLDRLDIAGDRLGLRIVRKERDPVGDLDVGPRSRC